MQFSKILLLISVFTIAGCAKKRDYESVGKAPELLSRATFEANYGLDKVKGREFLYLISSGDTPRKVPSASPHYQGTEKIVQMKFTKTGLSLFQVDKDGRFADNPFNESPVLTIPGDYKDYRCKTDANDNCTEEEEENKSESLTWDKRRFFYPKYEEIKVEELNDIELWDLESECVTPIEGGTRVLSLEMEPGVFNLSLEITYKTKNDLNCIWNYYANENLENATFKVERMYSIVALDKLASPDYEAVDYPVPDHSTFGFFKDKTQLLSEDLDPTRPKISYFLNRWNPKKGPVVYHLSDTFNKEENLYLKDATYKTVDRINKLFVDQNVDLQIELKEPSGKHPGDLRNSMIVLIDEPLDNGLLGYGPSVSNPRTGEILQARTNMYSGVLRRGVRRSYQAMVDITKEQAKQRVELGTTPKTLFNLLDALDELSLSAKIKSPFKIDLKKEEPKNIDKIMQYAHKAKTLKNQLINRNFELKSIKDPEVLKRMKKENPFELAMRIHSENNGYHSAMFNFDGLAKEILPQVKKMMGSSVTTGGVLKDWEDLSSDQRKEIAKVIMVHTYTATLVHEFGHNLGLRHNFSGSTDRENFYSEKEAKDLGMHAAPAYSSIMDYAYSDLNELSLYGKYDIAALKFAYSRKVDVVTTEEGKADKVEEREVKSTLQEMKTMLELDSALLGADKSIELKNFTFCTDSNAGLSALCNRFDEGTTYVEIANHHAASYFKKYKYRNWRDGRDDFSEYGLPSYVSRNDRSFKRMREIYESYEFFVSIFGAQVMDQGCSEEELKVAPICETINELRDATNIAGDFFLTILKTPDLTCAYALPSAPARVVNTIKMIDIYDEIRFDIDYVPSSCFDENVKDYLKEGIRVPGTRDRLSVVPVAETGLYFNDIKEPDPRFPFSSDLAVRGIWSDKLLAAQYLAKRNTKAYITEDDPSSMIDKGSIRSNLLNFIQHVTLGTPLDKPVPFQTEDGSLLNVPYEISADYIIPSQQLTSITSFFGLPNEVDTPLTKELLEFVLYNNSTRSSQYRKDAKILDQALSVEKIKTTDTVPSNFRQINIRGSKYVASPDNVLGGVIINNLINIDVLGQVTEKEIKDVLKARTSLPADFTAEEKLVLESFSIEEMKQLIPIVDTIPPGGDTIPELEAAVKIGSKGLERVIEVKTKLEVPPKGSSELVKRLYTLPLQALQGFTTEEGRNQLLERADTLSTILEDLPKV